MNETSSVGPLRKAGVIGLGYVGLPLCVAIGRCEIDVLAFDIDAVRVAGVNAGRSHIADVAEEDVARLRDSRRLEATTDMARLAECDLISICVPTPLRKTRDPDISYILAAVEGVAATLRPGQVVILESTTYPGTTAEIVLPRMEESGLRVGQDFFLAFSPERVDPGRRGASTESIPKVVGGITPACTAQACAYYERIFDKVVAVGDATTAEMVKMLENTFRQVNIGLINETAQICQRLGISVWEVVEAAATKPFGFMPFHPGPGLGGHCIPVDPHYLAWKMRSLNYTARFIELASAVNSEMPVYVVERIAEALNEAAKPVNGADVLLLGVAYKRNVSDVRESPALDIVTHLERLRARVSYHDPFVPEFSVAMPGGSVRSYRSEELTPERLERADIVVVVTDHSMFDPALLARHASLLFDTRNLTGRLAPSQIPSTCSVLRLGDGRRAD